MIFYVPDITKKEVETPHSAHMLSMRVRYKDKARITDLQGNWARIQIKEVDKKNKLIKYHLRKSYYEENTNSGVLFQAIPDKSYLEKLMEVAAIQGMKKIFLFHSERSVKQHVKFERLQRIILRGCELAENYWEPEVEFIDKQEDLEELIRLHKPVVLEHKRERSAEVEHNNTIIIGPEGGWSASEIEYFQSLDLSFHSMGKTVYPAWLAGFSYFERCK